MTSGRFEIGLGAVLEPPRTPLGASCPTLGRSWAGFGSFKIDLGRLLKAFGRVKMILDRLWNDFGAKIGAKISSQGEKIGSEMRVRFTGALNHEKLILNDSPMKIDDFCISASLLEPLGAVLGSFWAAHGHKRSVNKGERSP